MNDATQILLQSCRALSVFLCGVMLAFATAAPIAEYLRLPESSLLYKYTAFACHQLPTRSLFIFTSPMGLCARCFGLYLGFFAIVLFSRLRRISMILFILLLSPCIIDGTTQYLGLRMSNNYLRFFTGLTAGIGLGLLFIYLASLTLYCLLKRRKA